MIQRLRHGFARFFTGTKARLRRRPRPTGPPVKGHMANVIVVKPPDPRFKEAIFVLKDEYFLDSELSRQELLLQAREAAREYVASVCPPRRRLPPLPIILAAAASLMAILYFAKAL